MTIVDLGSEFLSPERPTGEQQTAERQAVERPAGEWQTVERQAVEQQTGEWQAVERQAGERPQLRGAVRVGVDVVDVDRVGRLLSDHPDGVHELFTPREIAYCRRKRHHDVHFAGRFAAKEAVLKAFGTGMGQRMRWTDVEIVNGPLGKPYVRLHGEVAALAARRGLTDIDLSLSHSAALAMAGVVTVWSGESGPCGST